MLELKTFAKRYSQECNSQDRILNNIEDLENFFEYFLHSDEHFVYKIICVNTNKTFECNPSTGYYDEFEKYAKKFLSKDIERKEDLL